MGKEMGPMPRAMLSGDKYEGKKLSRQGVRAILAEVVGSHERGLFLQRQL